MLSFATLSSLLFLIPSGLCSAITLTQTNEAITTHQDPNLLPPLLLTSLTAPSSVARSHKKISPQPRVLITRITTATAKSGGNISSSPTYEPSARPTCICTFEPTFMPTYEPTPEPSHEAAVAPVGSKSDTTHSGGIFTIESAGKAGLLALIIISVAIFLSIVALLSHRYTRVKTREEEAPVVPEKSDVEAPLHA